MRIIIDGIPRTVGGIGSLILNIAETSRKRNDDITFEFIISGYSAYIPILENRGYKYYIAPRVSEVKRYKEFITELFKNNKFDYLWFNNTSKVNIVLPAIAKRIGGAKIITHPHGVDFEEKGIKKLIFKFLDILHEQKMFSLIDIPFACSEQAAEVYYKDNQELRKKTTIIRNGISVSLFRYSKEYRERIRRELGCSDEDILLGAVGRLTKVKNYSFIISILVDMPSNYKLIILGEGEDYADLNKQIKQANLDNRCFLLGKKNNVNEYLSAMDIFLMPSLNEGMPYSLIEAQAAGLNCIVSDNLSKEIGITELVEYVTICDKNAWINEIMCQSISHDRTKYGDVIKKAGYSIEESYDTFRKLVC